MINNGDLVIYENRPCHNQNLKNKVNITHKIKI